MGIDGVLLRDAICITNTIVGIRYVNHYLEGAIGIIYIYTYIRINYKGKVWCYI